MDSEGPPASPAQGDTLSSARPTYIGRFWDIVIDGVHITPFDCPCCLNDEESDCDLCEFFLPKICRLRRDPFLFQDIKTVFDIYREHRAARIEAARKRLRALIKAVHTELKAHGRPLHYTVLARIVADRYPNLKATERRVLGILASRPRIFERVAGGVYRCRTN